VSEKKPLDSRLWETLDAIAEMGSAKTWEVADQLGLEKCGDAIRGALHELRKLGLVEIVERQADPPRRRITKSNRWAVTEDGRLLARRR